MNILALDLGSKTGWASLSDGKFESGVQAFALERGESQGMRFIRFNRWLSEMAELTKPQIIVYERAHMRGGWATEFLHGLTTRVMQICEERKIQHTSIQSSSLKKFATGSGRASKEDMKMKAGEILNRPPVDDNEADAVLLLEWAKRFS